MENRITYTGQMYDDVSGQYYLRARFYNPAVGRFTQEDVYRGDGLNLYAYCQNNPVMYYDPSGYIQLLCDLNKTNPGNEEDLTTAAQRRNSSGTVTGSEGLDDVRKMMRGSEGNIGVIPKEIGDRLRGRTYNNFDDFRKDFWREVSQSSTTLLK